MNLGLTVALIASLNAFPSPTGVNYYEFEIPDDGVGSGHVRMFPSPTGVNYYE